MCTNAVCLPPVLRLVLLPLLLLLLSCVFLGSMLHCDGAKAADSTDTDKVLSTTKRPPATRHPPPLARTRTAGGTSTCPDGACSTTGGIFAAVDGVGLGSTRRRSPTRRAHCACTAVALASLSGPGSAKAALANCPNRIAPSVSEPAARIAIAPLRTRARIAAYNWPRRFARSAATPLAICVVSSPESATKTAVGTYDTHAAFSPAESGTRESGAPGSRIADSRILTKVPIALGASLPATPQRDKIKMDETCGASQSAMSGFCMGAQPSSNEGALTLSADPPQSASSRSSVRRRPDRETSIDAEPLSSPFPP
mmetsp:Transcript_34573/g.86247  ORF Transcript_34573/g.86247 Transcript_34573/m.86247 type:complete len:312 (-) Transcript_34573:1539-2474(-)